MGTAEFRLFATLLGALAAAACTPAQTGNSPVAPVIIAGEVNSRVIPPTPGNPNAVVAFGRIAWQSDPRPGNSNDAAWRQTHRWGWRNDVLVENPYAMQLRISHRLGTDSLEVRDSSGNRLPYLTSRLSNSYACVAATPATPTTPARPASGECWPAPGDQRYRQPPALPDDAMHMSYEAVNACDGIPTPSLTNTDADRARVCNAGQTADAAIILTISPPTNGQPLQHGQVFDLSLVSYQGSGSSRLEAVTPLKLVFVEPGRCRTTMQAVPPNPQAIGTNVTLNWTSTGCARVVTSLAGTVQSDMSIDPTPGIADTPMSGSFTTVATAQTKQAVALGSDALASSGYVGRSWALIGPPPPRPPVVVIGSGGGGGGGNTSPAPTGPCSGGAAQQSFAFTMTCFAGGTAASWTVGASACSSAEAMQELKSIYDQEIMRGCVIR